jgi:hypothetical protein
MEKGAAAAAANCSWIIELSFLVSAIKSILKYFNRLFIIWEIYAT